MYKTGRPKNKYRKGKPITTLEQLGVAIDKNEYVYLHKKPLNPGFLCRMQLGLILKGLKLDYFSEAIDQQKEENK